jgi:hypothetical protein
MSDPIVPLNCPQCGEPLNYRKTGNAWRRKGAIIDTADEVHLYHCWWHGFYTLWPDGRLGYVRNSLRWHDPDDFKDYPRDL